MQLVMFCSIWLLIGNVSIVRSLIVHEPSESERVGRVRINFLNFLNTLDDELKRADTLGSFKTGIKESDRKGCSCLICK